MADDDLLAFFEREGYLVIPGALTPAELAEARWRADPARPGVRRPDLEQVLGIVEYAPAFLELLEQPRIFPLVRELLGPDLALLDHDYFMTPPGAAIPQGWHFDFDMPAVDHPHSRLLVKAFYVLEDIPPDGGATLVLPGSHRTDPGTPLPNSEVPEDLPGAVSLALPAGSAYLITGRTYHSAGNNCSSRVRRLLIYTYGHKWMRMWDEYRPSAALAARADTPLRRQLLGLGDPYGPPPAPRERSWSQRAAAAPSRVEAGCLTGAQRRFFDENGYLLVEDALTPEELAATRAAADGAEARWRADPSLPGTRIPEFLEIAAIMEYDPLLGALAEHPRVFPLVREVLGRDVSLVDHAYYITPPGGVLDGSAWHTDVRSRVPGVNHAASTMMVRAMYALEDVGEDGGATLVLPGSHRQPDDPPLPPLRTPEEMPGAVRLTCRAGSAYFFHGNLLHAPGTNRGRTTRRMLLYNYGHKWMRMWKGHEPSPRLSAQPLTPMGRQLLGLTPPYRGPEAELTVRRADQAWWRTPR